jgi:hypothetical protein
MILFGFWFWVHFIVPKNGGKTKEAKIENGGKSARSISPAKSLPPTVSSSSAPSIQQFSTMAMVPAAAAAFPRYSKRSTHIRIHRTVTSIPNQAFCQYEKVVAVELPAGLQRIGIEAFGVCQSLKEIHLWEGLQDIGDQAFCCCTSL